MAPSPANTPSLWTDAFLDGMRQVCDPPADEVIQQIYTTSGGIKAVNDLMATFVLNDQIEPQGLPVYVRDFLEKTQVLPAWADPKLIQAGGGLFWDYGPAMITTLFCDSLPFCYLGRKGVQVLALTARLYTNPTRRVIETAQFLVDTLGPNALGAQGGGIRAAQKIRMMHAAIRRQILESGLWRPDLDMPINQEDLAGTLMSFSCVVLDGVGKLGCLITAEQQEAYLHCWKVIGHILGVRDDLLPANVAAACSLAEIIQKRQAGDCPEGRMMTGALVEMLQQHSPHFFRQLPAFLIRYLLGDHWADMLGVASPGWEHTLTGGLEWLDKEISGDELTKLLAWLNSWFMRQLVEAIILIDRGGNRPAFRLPKELRGKWGIG